MFVWGLFNLCNTERCDYFLFRNRMVFDTIRHRRTVWSILQQIYITLIFSRVIICGVIDIWFYMRAQNNEKLKHNNAKLVKS